MPTQAQPSEQATQAAKTKSQASPPASRGSNNKPSSRNNISQAIVPVTVELRSRHAQRAYKRGYETAARALYALSILLPIYAGEDKAAQIGEHAEAMIEEQRTGLTEEIERMSQVAEEHGIDLSAIEYTNAQQFSAQITTPRAGQYLGLLREMDRLVSLIDVLWLSGVYDDQQHNNGAYHWQRDLIKLANQLRTLSGQAIAMAQKGGGESTPDEDTDADTGNETPETASESDTEKTQ